MIGETLIDWENPINWGHPLNRGIKGWWMVTPRYPSMLVDLVNHDPCPKHEVGIQNRILPVPFRGQGWNRVGYASIKATSAQQYGYVSNAYGPYQFGAPITMAAWFRATGVDATFGHVINASNWPTSGWSIIHDQNASTLTVRCMSSASQGIAGDTGYSWAAVNDGQWHHVVGTSQGSTTQIYVDDVFRNQNTSAGCDPPVPGTRASICRADGAGSIEVSDARVWNRVLRREEMTLLHRVSGNGNQGLLRMRGEVDGYELAAAAGGIFAFGM